MGGAMCHIYSNTDPIQYESRSRSVRIARVVTSIKLENLFWDTLSQLAHDEGMTTNQLIAKLYDEVYACGNEVSNFTSFLRVTCMRYSELRGQSMRDARNVLDRTVRHAAPAAARALDGRSDAGNEPSLRL
ncbi:Ribbon-helix-helix domain-containing protein [Castellaniella denitrificans]